MKAFWWSLFFFVLLMCSCKSKELTNRVRIDSNVSVLNECSKIDTTKSAQSEQVNEFRVIVEVITEETYDKDSGNVAKKTKTERTIVQGIEANIERAEERGLASSDSLFLDVRNMVDSTEEIETVTSGHTFGKWLAISLIFGIILLFLWKRL